MVHISLSGKLKVFDASTSCMRNVRSKLGNYDVLRSE